MRQIEAMRWALLAAAGIALTAMPFVVDPGHNWLADSSAFAARGGNSANAGGQGQGQGQGQSQGQGQGQVAAKGQSPTTNGLHASDLGRLNGFLHASDQARVNSSAKSAVGIVSQAYANALAGYLGAYNTNPLDPALGALLNDAAAILVNAANKPVTAAVVETINGELASMSSLGAPYAGIEAGLATAGSATVAGTIAGAAAPLEAAETEQGLGS